LFEKRFSYETYCLDANDRDEPLRLYIDNLISLADAHSQVPVFQFNRSLLRSGWLSRHFSSRNLLLLRNAPDIWSSFNTDAGRYYVTALCIILGQNIDTCLLGPIARTFGIPYFRSDDVAEEFRYYRSIAAERVDSLHMAFTAFYCVTALVNMTVADCIIDMTEITGNRKVRATVETRLRMLGIDIGLADVRMPSYEDLPSQEPPDIGDEVKEVRRILQLSPIWPRVPVATFRRHLPFLGPSAQLMYEAFLD
jgi:hypothetical protein